MPNRNRLSRRAFLRLTIGGGAALLIESCTRPPVPPTPTSGVTPTASPTSSAAPSATTPPGVTASSSEGTVYLPGVQVGDEATATATATATGTATATPTASATPAPTATPVPPGTPFPAGPPTKLGLFVGYQHPTMEQMLRTGNVPLIKTLEYDPQLMAFIKQISPNAMVVSRYTPLPDLDLTGRLEPIAEARRFVEILRPIALDPKRLANIDYWEAYNEPIANSADEMARLADFEAERTRLLAADGIRSCIGNFATGTPELDLWPAFFPALQAAKEYDGILGLHEYSAPVMTYGTDQEAGNGGDEGWLTLRYRKVYRQHLTPNKLDIPLIITETGVDGGIRDRPGPQGFGWADFQGYWKEQGLVRTTGAGFYVEQLAWYDSELVKDDYVRGAAIYALAAPTGWGSFEILGDVATILTQYLSVHSQR